MFDRNTVGSIFTCKYSVQKYVIQCFKSIPYVVSYYDISSIQELYIESFLEEMFSGDWSVIVYF